MPDALRPYLRVVLAAAAGLMLGLALNTAPARSPPLDPPRIAPHIFEVLLENERVRVLRVTERHGETQPLHRRADRVVVHLNPCAWVVEADDGSTRMEGFKLGDVYWRDAVTLGGHTSNVIQECRSLEIELKNGSTR